MGVFSNFTHVYTTMQNPKPSDFFAQTERSALWIISMFSLIRMRASNNSAMIPS